MTCRIVGARCCEPGCPRPHWKDGLCSPCWYAGRERGVHIEPLATVVRVPDFVPEEWTR